MHEYICVCVCVCVCVYARTHILRACMHAYMYMYNAANRSHLEARSLTADYTVGWGYTRVHVEIYTHTYVYMCVYLYIYIYIYIRTYTFICFGSWQGCTYV